MAEKQLDIELFNTDIQPWPNSVILKGENSCALIDCQFLKVQGQALAEAIKATDLPLTDIYITHSHPDHVWGVVEVLKAFPEANVWAREGVKREIELEWRARLIRWLEIFPGQLPTELPEISLLETDTIDVEGHTVKAIDLVGCETIFATAFYLPESKTFISGDVLYADCHYYLCGGLNRPDSWAKNLRDIKANYDIERIVPGHGSIGGMEILDFGLEYLDTYASVYTPQKHQLAIAEEMEARYPDLTLEGVLYMTLGPGPTSPEIMEKTGGKITFGSHKPR